MRLFMWLVQTNAWLDRLFDRIGVVEKYLETIALAIVGLAELCEESPSVLGLDTSALNDDLPELVVRLSVIAKEGGAKA